MSARMLVPMRAYHVVLKGKGLDPPKRDLIEIFTAFLEWGDADRRWCFVSGF